MDFGAPVAVLQRTPHGHDICHVPEPAPTQRSTHRQYGGDRGPYLVGHRGAAGLAPENTMVAFSQAIALGVRYLETDVRTTKDGVAVAFHDRTLQRVTDLRGPVHHYTYKQLSRALVAGTDESVPRIDEVIGSFPGTRFMIDVKDERSLLPLARAIRRTGSAARICLAGTWDGWLARMPAMCGDRLQVALGWQSWAKLVVATKVGVAEHISLPRQAQWVHAPWRLGHVPVMADPKCRARIMALATRLGIRVMVWTVNDVDAATTLLDAGVSGVITDRPDLLRPAWVAQGLASPDGDAD